MTDKYPGEPIADRIASALHPTPLGSLAPRMQTIVGKVMARADAELAAGFKGLSTDGSVISGLFPMRKTRVSVQPLISAAEALVALLDEAQRKALTLPIDSHEWRTWNNMHFFLFRHGVLLDELSERQRAAALGLVRATLSASGFETARNVMKLNEHIAELTGHTEDFGEWYYWMTLFGTPSPTEPWGWQLDGHHLIINCFVLGDQLVLTPDFQGSEPVHAESGIYAGTRVFHDEEARGHALMQALSPAQRERAIIGTAIPRDVVAMAHADNAVVPQAGIRYDELSTDQRALLLALITTYTGRIRPGHAEIRLEEVKAHLAETTFGWIGPVDAESPFYYRVQSPVILIEFDHLPGVAYTNQEPTRRHVHTIVRTPNGNDYGRDLLRQHYEQHDHSNPHSPHRRGRE